LATGDGAFKHTTRSTRRQRRVDRPLHGGGRPRKSALVDTRGGARRLGARLKFWGIFAAPIAEGVRHRFP